MLEIVFVSSLCCWHPALCCSCLLTELSLLIFRISWFTCFSCWWFCSSTTLTRPKTHTAWDCALSCNEHYTRLSITASTGKHARSLAVRTSDANLTKPEDIVAVQTKNVTYLSIWSEPHYCWVRFQGWILVICFVTNLSMIFNEVSLHLEQNPEAPVSLWLSIGYPELCGLVGKNMSPSNANPQMSDNYCHGKYPLRGLKLIDAVLTNDFGKPLNNKNKTVLISHIIKNSMVCILSLFWSIDWPLIWPQ